MTTTVEPRYWQPRLSTRWAGRPKALYAPITDSTNLQLKVAARRGAPHGTVALCEAQTAGRGRMDRQWHSPQGKGLWVSLLARPALKSQDAPLITFAAALAMCRAVEDAGFAPRIKWPNDLVLEGKKICGILLEMGLTSQGTLDFVIIGAGLNTAPGSYPAELSHQAACLEEIGGHPVDRNALLVSYLHHLEEALESLEKHGLPGIRPAYERRQCTLGSEVQVSGGMDCRGTAIAIDDSGALIVEESNGSQHIVRAGDVSVRGIMGYV